MKESFSKKAVGERLKGFRLSMQMLYDKCEIDITYLLTGNKPDFDNHLRQLWLTASRVEKKLILARLISYVEEML